MAETLKKVGNYKLVREIGSGSFSKVYQGRKEGQLQRFAIKMIKAKAMSKQQREIVEKQVLITKSIEHPNIVKLYQTLATANNYYLIFQFCEKGDLQKYLKENLGTLLNLDSVRKIMKCIGGAIMHIHSKGIAHRDLKMANILLKKDLTIKLADFGFAKEQTAEDFMMKTYCGSPITMAPQILKGKPYDKKCDIWSLGVILFQLVFSRLPFSIKQGYLEFIQKVAHEKLQFPEKPKIPDSLKELIQGCLQKNQSNRIDIQQFMESEWMKEESTEETKEEKPETVNNILKRVAKESKNIEYQTQQIQTEGKSVSIFERLLSCRVCDIISSEFNKILERHVELRKQISQIIQNHKDLRQALEYYDRELLTKWQQKQLKIRLINQQDVYIPISAIKSVKFPKPLTDEKTQQIALGTTLMEYLRTLAKTDMELQKKKLRYRLVINFLQLVHNFQLEVTIFFNSNYEIEFSLQRLAEYIRDGNINEEDEKDYHKGLNHITIALECRQKDQRFREVADNLKINCEKRIDDIQRQINGY